MIKKLELNCQVDDLYIKLIDFIKEDQDKCIDNFKEKSFKFDENTRKKFKKYKESVNQFFEQLNVVQSNEESYKAIRMESIKSREDINAWIRDYKSKLLMNKGFEYESKQFNFPDLKNTGLMPVPFLKKETNIEFTVKDVKKNSEIESSICLSEKKSINHIPFYFGVKFEKDKNKILNVYACLYCSNEYEFSGVSVEYTVTLLHKSTGVLDVVKSYDQTLKHFALGYKKLVSYKQMIDQHYDEKEDSIKVVVSIKLLDVVDRKTKKQAFNKKTVKKEYKGIKNHLNFSHGTRNRFSRSLRGLRGFDDIYDF